MAIKENLRIDIEAKNKASAEFKKLDTSLGKTTMGVGLLTRSLAPLAAVFGIAGLAKGLINTNKEFQSLEASLITFMGSTKLAKGAFKQIRDFAQETPFEVADVTQAYINLVSVGIRPTIAQFKNFGDVAGGTGKTFSQFTNAIRSATTGEMESLKQFGITAKQTATIVEFTFDDMTVTAEKNGKSIANALEKISQKKFAGGMELQAKTLTGAFSNVKDVIANFAKDIGDAGLNKRINEIARSLAKWIKENNHLAKRIAGVLIKALDLANKAIIIIQKNAKILTVFLGLMVTRKIVQNFISFAGVLLKFGKQVMKIAIVAGIVNLAFTKVGLVIAGVATVTALVADQFVDLKKVLSGWFEDNMAKANAWMDSMLNAAFGTGEFKNQVEDTSSALDDFSKSQGIATTEQQKMEQETKRVTDAMDGMRLASDQTIMSINDMALEAREWGIEVAALDQANIDLVTSLGKIHAILAVDDALGIQKFWNSLRQSKIDADLATIAVATHAAEIDAYKKSIQFMDTGKIDFTTMWTSAGLGMADYFNEASNLYANFRTSTKTVLSSLEASFANFFSTGKLDFKGFIDTIKTQLASLAAKAVVVGGLNFLSDMFPSISAFLPGKKDGGLISKNQNYAQGGFVSGPGGPTTDSILARLSDGEYVINAKSVKNLGIGTLDRLNSGQSGPMDTMGAATGKGGLAGFGWFSGIFDWVKGTIDTIIDVITDTVKYVSQSVKNTVEGIMSGDPIAIAGLLSSFIVPGVFNAIAGVVGSTVAGTTAMGGFIGNVGSAISASFANGILGGGSLSAIATSVGTNLASGALIDGLTTSIGTNVLGWTKDMGNIYGGFGSGMNAAFGKLYSEASPFFAAETGGSYNRGDAVKVGEQGPELFVPNRNGSVAPIKGGGLIEAINEVRDEMSMVRRRLDRAVSAGALAGVR